MVTGMFHRRPALTQNDELTSHNTRRFGAASTSKNADRLLTTAEVAERLRVSTSFLAKARVAGLGPRFIDLGLPIQRDVPGELEHRDMGDQRGCGYATLDEARRALGLDDRSFTRTTCAPSGTSGRRRPS